MKTWLPMALLALLPALPLPACAQGAVDGDPAAAHEILQAFVAQEVEREHPGVRAQITVGDIDPHLHLAACAQAEAFLRPGSRLWGRSFVGYRCLQRPGWSVSVPVEVRLFGPALVSAQALPALQAITSAVVRLEEVELTRQPGAVATSLDQVLDRFSTRALEPGQPLALANLRTVPAVGQGDAVKLLGTGNGFQISTDGIALATASDGETVRVRTETGRTLTGVARKGRVVEVVF